MPPDPALLLIDSLPAVKEALKPLNSPAETGVIPATDLEQAMHLLRRQPEAGRPSLAVVPLAVWHGMEPASVAAALMGACPDLPVILCGPSVPEPWRQWVEQHPASPRLLTMSLPLDLNVLRLLGAAVAAARQADRGSAGNTASAHSAPAGPAAFSEAASGDSGPSLLGEARSMVTPAGGTGSDSALMALRHSEERFAAAFRAAPFPQAILNFTTGQIVEANAAFCALTGFSHTELTAHSRLALQSTELLGVLHAPHPMAEVPVLCRDREGKFRHLILSTQPTSLGGVTHLMLMAQDDTARVLLEERLRQARKLEALGQLAAGVAHDFNNILTIIQGQLSLQLETQDFAPAARGALQETLEAAGHAGTLTRQLLALSRCQMLEPGPVDVNAVIRRMSSILQRLIGEHIDVEWQCAPGLPSIRADLAGIEQVIMSLVLQARDAMPRGGRLRIATGLSRISAAQAAQNPEASEGGFVRFSIVDTGQGMDQETVERLMATLSETRTAPHESGSVLASVWSIVRQHGGWIELFSSPGQGTAFFVYLPVPSTLLPEGPAILPGTGAVPSSGGAAPGHGAASSLSRLLEGHPRAGLTVLVVEDEPAVRGILRQLLVHCGCTVLEAPDAPAALAIWEAEHSRIQLLITDIVMPGGMTGHELAARLTDDRPSLRVIYSSGYSSSPHGDGVPLIAGRNFLPKPFDAASVVALIRRVAAERTELLGA